MNVVERLEANSIWEPNTGCLLWQSTLVREHGVMKVHGKIEQAHRVAWEVERGRIPKGLWVLHSCGVSCCINVQHLRLGHRSENARDRHLHGGYQGRPGGGVLGTPRIVSGTPARLGRQTRVPMTRDEVRAALDYDPDTGVFRWRVRPDRDHSWNLRFSGEVAGNTMTHGYRCMNILGKLHLAHRLAWLWMTGEMPAGHIDHINGDRSDNRWCNLRLATNSQNQMNRALSPKNVSGVKGVTWNKKQKTWVAHLTVNEKQMHLGQSRSLDVAVKLRRDAEAKYHGEYAHKGVE